MIGWVQPGPARHVLADDRFAKDDAVRMLRISAGLANYFLRPLFFTQAVGRDGRAFDADPWRLMALAASTVILSSVAFRGFILRSQS